VESGKAKKKYKKRELARIDRFLAYLAQNGTKSQDTDQYTPEAKANGPMMDYAIGEIPPPGKVVPNSSKLRNISQAARKTTTNLTLKQQKVLLSSAGRPYNKELSQMAHSFSKHSRRHPEKWGVLKGSGKN